MFVVYSENRGFLWEETKLRKVKRLEVKTPLVFLLDTAPPLSSERRLTPALPHSNKCLPSSVRSGAINLF